MENDNKRLNDADNNSKNYNHKDKEPEGYRIGMGIDFIDQNVISGPDIERVVNGKIITPDEVDDITNKV